MSKNFHTLVITTPILEFTKFDEEYSFECYSGCKVVCDDAMGESPIICSGCDNNMGMQKLGQDSVGRDRYQ